MALDAGEVFVVVGAKLDSSSIAKANAAQRSLLTSSNEYQKAIDRGEAASSKLHAANERWMRAAVIGAKGAAIGVGTVTAALAGAAVAAASFDASMRNVNSIAGLSEKGFKNLEGQVLRLSTAVGKSPKDLAEGLYSIVSSGFKAADAMKILTAGARAARAGLTDTATATGAITSVLNAYNLGAGQAKNVSDLLFQTVNVGVLNFEQLAGSLGKVLPSAKGLGVSLKDLLGAEAALTLQGNSADEATTQLGQVMSSLTKPSVSLAKELKDLGYESGQAAIAHLGFKGTLDALGKAAHGNQALLAQWFGNIRAFRGVNGLEGTAHAADLFTTSVKAMGEATKGAGVTAQVYAEQQKSTAAQFEHLKAAVDVAAITIGTALLPMINQGIHALTAWLAEAQKSGELQQWAHDIAHGVSEIVEFLHSLGPAAEKAFHVVTETVQAAIPFVEALYKILQDIAPAIEDVAHAASGLASALGPGPILAAVAAFVALRRATLTGQAAMGTYSRIMQAGQTAIGTAGDGALIASGRFNKIGTEAVKSASFAKIAAQGIASSFGPQLIAVGAAATILALVKIRSTMTTLKDEAQQAADAMIRVNDARLKVRSAKTDVKQAKLDVAKALEPTGTAAVRVANARAAVAASQGHPGSVADPAAVQRLTAAEQAQEQVLINVQRARDRLTAANKAATEAGRQLTQASKDLGKQYGGLSSHADGAVRSFQAAQQWSGKVRDTQKEAAEAARIWANDLVKTSKSADGATAATEKTAAGVAALVRELGHPPTPKETTIIVNGLKAGKTVAQIRAAVLKLEKLHPVIPVAADPTDANKDFDDVARKANALDALRPKVHLGASGFDGVSAAIDAVNSKILHLTSTPFTVKINEAAGRTGHFDKKGQWVYGNAAGTKTSGPEIALIGEGAAPEYVIPTEPKYRKGGIALWMQAGHDLGIPGYKAGKGPKPGKTPPPVSKALGYDPNALDNQQSAEKTRLDNARTERDQLAGRIKTDSDHLKALEKQQKTAQRAAGSKNKKTAAAGRDRLASVTDDMKKTQGKIDDERKARQHQVGEVIPAAIKRYQAATRAARIGHDHQAKIDLWNARADTASNQMSTASAQWDAADRKNNQPGRDKAYKAWDTARKARIADLAQVKSLLQEVMSVVGKTKYGAEIAGQLSTAIGDITSAQDDTQAPGYTEPDDPQAPSTDINDYLLGDERNALAQSDLDSAKAASTADTADDVAAAHEALGVAVWIRDRLEQQGAPIDIVTQAYQAVASANSDLASAISGNTPDSTTSGVTADQQAALDQANTRAANAEATSASDRAALATFGSSLDLMLAGGGGGTTINVGVRALTADSPSVQRAVGQSVVQAIGSQPYIPTSRGTYGG